MGHAEVFRRGAPSPACLADNNSEVPFEFCRVLAEHAPTTEKASGRKDAFLQTAGASIATLESMGIAGRKGCCEAH